MHPIVRHILVHAAPVAMLMLAFGMTLSCAGNSGDKSNRPVPPRREGALIDGIDVSSHQGDINWDKVTANDDIRFAYVKATEGATYQSPHYAYNVEQAQRYHLLVGSYHYLATTSTIHQQYLNFVRTIDAQNQDLIPMIDVEERGSWSRAQLIDSLTLFADLLEKHYKKKPMIYSTMDFYNQNLSPQFNKYPLYIGRYSGEKPVISWEGDYTVWQFSENGIIAGINSYVDECRFHPQRDLNDLLLH